MVKVWNWYKELVRKNTITGSVYKLEGIDFWKNIVFSRIITYILPVGILAAVPGIIMSIIGKIPLLALFDSLAILFLILIAFVPGISLNIRKWLLIIILYLLAIILIYYLGSWGPGLLYLLAVSIFMSLIFPSGIALYSILINVLICLTWGILIHYSFYRMPPLEVITTGGWVAVSTNVILLSVCCVMGLNMLFNGLESTIRKEIDLHKMLTKETRETRKVVNALEKKNHELEQFAFIASHDLQEPMITIQSFIGLITADEKHHLSKEEKEYLSYIAQSSEKMHFLINGLLQFALLGRKRINEDVNLNEVLQEVNEEMKNDLIQSEALIDNTPLPVIAGNRNELKLLFQNLISNALKYAHPDRSPHLEITAELKGNKWHFIFRDNGIGIHEKDFKRIFIIFQQVHERGKYDGTGIGLAYCKKIVEMHEGSIWLNSVPGEGSEFHFTIPVE